MIDISDGYILNLQSLVVLKHVMIATVLKFGSVLNVISKNLYLISQS